MLAKNARRFLTPLAAAALLCGAAACGDTAATPSAAPSASPTAAPAPATSEAPPATAAAPTPAIPKPDRTDYPGMDQHTEDGAIQAYRYFWAMMTWAYHSGDYSEVAELSVANCDSCRQNFESIDTLAERGELWSNVSLQEDGAEAFESEFFDLEIGYIFEIDSGAVGLDGPPETDSQKHRYVTVGGMRWSGDHWTIEEFTIEDSDQS